MEITVSVDTSKLDRLLADFPQAFAAAQRNALVAIGDEVKSEADQTFRNPAMRPSPWAPRKPTYTVTVNKRTGKKKRIETGTDPFLQRSILPKTRHNRTFHLHRQGTVPVRFRGLSPFGSRKCSHVLTGRSHRQ